MWRSQWKRGWRVAVPAHPNSAFKSLFITSPDRQALQPQDPVLHTHILTFVTHIHTIATPTHPATGGTSTLRLGPIHTMFLHLSTHPQLQVVLRPQDPVVLRWRATGVGAGTGGPA